MCKSREAVEPESRFAIRVESALSIRRRLTPAWVEGVNT